MGGLYPNEIGTGQCRVKGQCATTMVIPIDLILYYQMYSYRKIQQPYLMPADDVSKKLPH